VVLVGVDGLEYAVGGSGPGGGALDMLERGIGGPPGLRLEHLGRPMYPERLHAVALTLDITTRLLEVINDFCDNAAREVQDWPSTTNSSLAPATRNRLEAIQSRTPDTIEDLHKGQTRQRDVSAVLARAAESFARMPGMPESRIAHVDVHYEQFGHGRPLVVLPGWPDDWTVPADYLEPVMRGREGWQRFYIDLPGRGRTTAPASITTNDDVLDIVLGLLDDLLADRRFVLAGHSMGAYLARGVLHRRMSMIDGLLQVVPAFPDHDEDLPTSLPPVPSRTLVEQARRELGTDLAAAFSRLFVQTPEMYQRFKALVPGFTRHDAAFLERLERRLSFDADQLPNPFERPALFVLGRQDTVVGFRAALDLMDQYPEATMTVLDRSGHALPWEQEALFQALLTDWLDRVEDR
jgi:pimeloyl-ACP methyl ester carboxylesterase